MDLGSLNIDNPDDDPLLSVGGTIWLSHAPVPTRGFSVGIGSGPAHPGDFAHVARLHNMCTTPMHDARAGSSGVVHAVSPNGVHKGDMSMSYSGSSISNSMLLDARMVPNRLPRGVAH